MAAVELGNEHQPTVIRGVQVAGEFGDLRFEFADRKTARRRFAGGVFHDRTGTVVMYSIVANNTYF